MFPAYIPDGFQVTETKLHSNANDENVKFVMLYEDGTDYLIFQVSHGGDSLFLSTKKILNLLKYITKTILITIYSQI